MIRDAALAHGSSLYAATTVYDELRRKNAAMRGKTPAERHMLDVEYFETLIAEQKSTEQLAIEKDQRQRLLKSVYSLPEKIQRYNHTSVFPFKNIQRDIRNALRCREYCKVQA